MHVIDFDDYDERSGGGKPGAEAALTLTLTGAEAGWEEHKYGDDDNPRALTLTPTPNLKSRDDGDEEGDRGGRLVPPASPSPSPSPHSFEPQDSPSGYDGGWGWGAFSPAKAKPAPSALAPTPTPRLTSTKSANKRRDSSRDGTGRSPNPNPSPSPSTGEAAEAAASLSLRKNLTDLRTLLDTPSAMPTFTFAAALHRLGVGASPAKTNPGPSPSRGPNGALLPESAHVDYAPRRKPFPDFGARPNPDLNPDPNPDLRGLRPMAGRAPNPNPNPNPNPPAGRARSLLRIEAADAWQQHESGLGSGLGSGSILPDAWQQEEAEAGAAGIMFAPNPNPNPRNMFALSPDSLNSPSPSPSRGSLGGKQAGAMNAPPEHAEYAPRVSPLRTALLASGMGVIGHPPPALSAAAAAGPQSPNPNPTPGLASHADTASAVSLARRLFESSLDQLTRASHR